MKVTPTAPIKPNEKENEKHNLEFKKSEKANEKHNLEFKKALPKTSVAK